MIDDEDCVSNEISWEMKIGEWIRLTRHMLICDRCYRRKYILCTESEPFGIFKFVLGMNAVNYLMSTSEHFLIVFNILTSDFRIICTR